MCLCCSKTLGGAVATDRSSHQTCSINKGVLKNFANITDPDTIPNKRNKAKPSFL